MSLYSDLNDVLTPYAQKIKDKADKSTTYTKTEVDNLVSEVEVETDTTLDIPGAPADSAETGRQIGLLKADLDYEIEPYNAVDLLYKNRAYSNGTKNGVTYTFNGNQCSLSGTATSTSFMNIYNDVSNLPIGMKAGDVIHFKYSTSKTDVRLGVFFRNANNQQTGIANYLTADKDIQIPLDAVGMIVRIDVVSGTTTNITVTFRALLVLSNVELENHIYRDRSKFVPLPFGWFNTNGIASFDIIDMPINSFAFSMFSKIKEALSGTNMPLIWGDNDVISIWCKETAANSSAVNRVFDLYNFTKTEKLVLLYFGSSSGVKYRWITSGTINNYTINQYANEYNVTATPNITADTNNYLQSTGDQTDMASAIVTMLTQTGVCNLAPGTFYVSGVDMPNNTMIRGSGAATNIVLLDSVSDGYAIKMGSNCIVEDVKISGGASAPTITSTIGTRHGIIWQGTATSNTLTSANPTRGAISNVHLWYFSGSGLKCYGSGISTSNCLNAVNIYVRECTVGINIEFLSEFHKFTNVDCRECYYGCINNGGNNLFVNCGFNKSIVGLLMDNSNNQSPNNSHGTFSGCIFNHSGANNDGTAIHIIGCGNGEMFVGCQIFFGATIIENSSGIVFSACNYKGSTGSPININGGGLVKLVDCVFGSTASITITNNTTTVVDGCYIKDGTAVVLN